MPRFRRKPTEVDAEQWFPDREVRGVRHGLIDLGTAAFYVVTAHGQKTVVAAGDWIIREPDGRGYYPCKPDIFAATYELVKG
jgi:hypothetical protein